MYCKDADRLHRFERSAFTSLSYTFRAAGVAADTDPPILYAGGVGELVTLAVPGVRDREEQLFIGRQTTVAS